MKISTFTIFAFILIAPEIFCQEKKVISITHLESSALSVQMENYVSILIREINKSYSAGSLPIFPSECVGPHALENIYGIWKNSPFKFITTSGNFKGIITAMGYQIRGLAIQMQEGKIIQNGVINFNPNGRIESFYFAIEENLYNAVSTENHSLQDQQKRQFILNFIEEFRTAYNRKDLNLISRIYGEDVLIITGYIYRVSNDKATVSGLTEEKVQFNLYNKNEYISRLKEVFQQNRFVNLFFEDIFILQHPSFPNIYGVTLLQRWRSTRYNDDGWLFMAVEFKSATEMLIHVRTWQPYILNRMVFPREEVYQLGNFEFR
ncbi:hypothetical protein [uncultured Odoribacter sp.]|uniref:hypothetical protein n=1 Tax=uncultured Odoribacter sp. TaxID=876416 RepID=UPI0026233194|nr:hypothetical protein [uncultured Odoribacter sp.]